MIQGQSKVTPDKLRGLAATLTINLQIFQRSFAEKHWARYFHFDLNAGCGMNEKAGCVGSPLAFLSAAEGAGCRRFSAWFVDLDKGACQQLAERPSVGKEVAARRVAIYQGDNAAFTRRIPDLIEARGENPAMAFGTVLTDPNGTKGLPLDELVRLAARCHRLDLIINWNAAQWKREAVIEERASAPGFNNREQARIRLATALERLEQHKKHWLVRENLGKSQFIMLIGRNYDTGEYRKLGFHRRESELGKAVLLRGSYTPQELDKMGYCSEELKALIEAAREQRQREEKDNRGNNGSEQQTLW